MSDEQLMLVLQSGESEALAILYERYHQKLCRYVYRLIQDAHRAEDLVQEVFEKINRQPEMFDTHRNLSSWIYTVCGNMARNEMRNRQQHQRYVRESLRQGEDSAYLHHQLDKQRLQQALQQCIDTLSEKEKTLYHLRFTEQLSLREIASHMQLPEGSVKSGLFYLLKKFAPIRKQFSDEH
ncbi:MAG: hypothetical protein RIQ62_1221 [Bacteroidota bacterium]|jgi:RNA polymerase sigma-70 factor (ECF subfamily)